ncbi:TetR/AcrR family transcriptional regulator [Isoptericola sp. NEAU-Y5]|uniref:TetR/AcrR family transcriptional regulator n=1 Tax=Isoptericola luteus TaxID=2879484 RepID=A0ABS7ZEE3_9MICO|nr:TetR/AcrR family transcriptional regulator [Isoptericola sp. NEAU-Y5]MCA5893418.1 TetR/AcrR family transcriptional regulator [Isoptericola sp. NEAU-Y5]
MPRPLVPDRRGRILDAARALMLERGWSRTTVADVAARAGIGKGAVYLELPGKAAILDAVLRRSTRALTAEVHRRVVDAPGLVDLPAVYRFGVDALLGDPLMRALYLGDDGVLGDHVRDLSGSGEDRYRHRFGWLGAYVARLQDAGVLDDAVAPDTVVRVLALFTVGLVHAPGTLGATTDEQLRDAVTLFAGVVGRGLQGAGPVDAAAARAAQLDLLARLDHQLELLEDPA